jgi:hypothetical protein
MPFIALRTNALASRSAYDKRNKGELKSKTSNLELELLYKSQMIYNLRYNFILPVSQSWLINEIDMWIDVIENNNIHRFDDYTIWYILKNKYAEEITTQRAVYFSSRLNFKTEIDATMAKMLLS